MDTQEIQQQIRNLVEREQALRDAGPATDPDQHAEQLRQVGEQLDQCWDLLRQRRARIEAGEDPDDTSVRPVSEVEGYRQ